MRKESENPTPNHGTSVDVTQQDDATLPLPTNDNIFDSNFDVTVEMHEYLADATHGFWADFPGSMEI